MAARHGAASPGPQGSTMGRSRRGREGCGGLNRWWRAQIISSSLFLSRSLSLLPPPSHLTSPPLSTAAPPHPNPSHSVPWSTFSQIPAQYSSWGCSSGDGGGGGGGGVGGGGGACGVSAEGRYNAQKSCLKQKAEHLLKRLRGKYVWQLLFTVTVVTVSTPKSKPRHFSICSETDGPTAIH